MTDPKPRRTITAEVKAQDALDVARRKLERLNARADILADKVVAEGKRHADAMTEVDHETEALAPVLAEAMARCDYLAQDPALRKATTGPDLPEPDSDPDASA